MAAQLPFPITPDPAAHAGRDRWPGFVAASLRMAPPRLEAFTAAMDREGIPFDATRLFFDPVYAYKRLELAHASADDELKTLALEMFHRYKALERRRRSISAFDRLH